jgi:hypothetical protein
MKLQLVRHLWGVDLGNDPTPLFDHWKSVGYEALEFPLGLLGDRDRKAFFQQMRQYGFLWVPQVFTDGANVMEHVASLRRVVEETQEFSPLFINAHSGSDAWSRHEAEDFYGVCLELESSFGLSIAHETHRMRYFSSPWLTRHILELFPTLKITSDFSHWVCMAERLLPDCGEIIALAASRTFHVHARVGHEEGPQVSDPRAPEWQAHLAAHEAWWHQVWMSQRERGFEVSTLTPEFGPPPYMPTLPYSREPVADLAAICDWMALRQAERFSRLPQ